MNSFRDATPNVLTYYLSFYYYYFFAYHVCSFVNNLIVIYLGIIFKLKVCTVLLVILYRITSGVAEQR